MFCKGVTMRMILLISLICVGAGWANNANAASLGDVAEWCEPFRHSVTEEMNADELRRTQRCLHYVKGVMDQRQAACEMLQRSFATQAGRVEDPKNLTSLEPYGYLRKGLANDFQAGDELDVAEKVAKYAAKHRREKDEPIARHWYPILNEYVCPLKD